MKWILLGLALGLATPAEAQVSATRAQIEGAIVGRLASLGRKCSEIVVVKAWVGQVQAALSAGDTGSASPAGYAMAQKAARLPELEAEKQRLQDELETLRMLLEDVEEPLGGIIDRHAQAEAAAAAAEAEVDALTDSLADEAVTLDLPDVAPLSAQLMRVRRHSPLEPEWRIDYGALKGASAGALWAAAWDVRTQLDHCGTLGGKARGTCLQAAAANAQLVAQNARRLAPRDPALTAETDRLREEIAALRGA